MVRVIDLPNFDIFLGIGYSIGRGNILLDIGRIIHQTIKWIFLE